MNIPPLDIKIVLESNTLNSNILVRRLVAVLNNSTTTAANDNTTNNINSNNINTSGNCNHGDWLYHCRLGARHRICGLVHCRLSGEALFRTFLRVGEGGIAPKGGRHSTVCVTPQ